MSLLDELNQCNDVKIRAVSDAAFRPYGRVLAGYDWGELIAYMEQSTDIPVEGNCYTPSVDAMEGCGVAATVRDVIYGGMPIQIGYCNGRNTTYNGFEYHKGSEINVAVTDFMLVLGHSYDITDLSYDVSQAEVFFVPKGTAIEMYQTTLHLSPLRVGDEGFKAIVILPRGTNTPLDEGEIQMRSQQREQLLATEDTMTAQDSALADQETMLLLQRNKWVIAHPDREPLIRQGAYPGVTGENKELYYPRHRES